MKTTSYEEFKEHCRKNSDQFTGRWDINKFKIVCQKCKSDKVQIMFKDKQYSCGSTQTGMWTSQDSSLTVKCWGCGHAMIIDSKHSWDDEDDEDEPLSPEEIVKGMEERNTLIKMLTKNIDDMKSKGTL